MQTSHLNLLNW